VDDNEEEAGGSKKEKVRISRDERKLDDDDYSLIQVANPPTDALVLENALALALTPGLLPSLSCCLPVPVVLLPSSVVAEECCASRSPRIALCSLLFAALARLVAPARCISQRHKSPLCTPTPQFPAMMMLCLSVHRKIWVYKLRAKNQVMTKTRKVTSLSASAYARSGFIRTHTYI